MNVNEFLFDAKGNLVSPIQITLSESAGPIPPPYAYFVDVKLSLEEDVLWLTHEEKAYRLGKDTWKREIKAKIALNTTQTEVLAQLLLDAGFETWKTKDFTEQEHTEVGVSLNKLSITWGSKKLDFNYKFKELENTQYTQQVKVLNYLRKLYTLERGE